LDWYGLVGRLTVIFLVGLGALEIGQIILRRGQRNVIAILRCLHRPRLLPKVATSREQQRIFSGEPSVAVEPEYRGYQPEKLLHVGGPPAVKSVVRVPKIK
jgi:hypothetical protein